MPQVPATPYAIDRGENMDTEVHMLLESNLSSGRSEAMYIAAELAYVVAVCATAVSDIPFPCQRNKDVTATFFHHD
jgi:hypothetical protein